MVTTTTSPSRAASAGVAALAFGPRSCTTSARVSGPLLLLSTTSWPAVRASRATVVPMFPLPMNPQAVMVTSTARPDSSFRPRRRCPIRHDGVMSVPERSARNVVGGPLEECGTDPVTGFYRDGCCNTGPQDVGSHTVCAVVTADFLVHQQGVGNDLSTPRPEYG